MAEDAKNGSGGSEGNAPEKPFAVSAPQVSLPKGGGALRGIGEKFAANPVTGTGSLTVPLAFSAGRSGFGPQLSLAYDSGAGNGPFGLGWSLALPSITRRTDKGLPRYDDADESDVFVFSGAEDLVPVLVDDANGGWKRAVVERDGYLVWRYRPRIEGLFACIERWTRQSDGDTYWRAISRDNVTTFYGKTAESRIADPAEPGNVFTWLICESRDDKGNATVYEYVAEDSTNIDLAQANERNRSDSSRSANRYLKRVKYGNTISTLMQQDLSKLSWLFEAVFDYGEGHSTALSTDSEGREFVAASLNATQPWPARQDPFSRYRACFEVRCYRLCRRVLMFHHFGDELGTPDYLVRATEFTYREGPVASFIVAVSQAGFVRQQDGTYLRRALPALEFEYTTAEIQSEVQEVDAASLANLPANVDGTQYQWLDLDGEGLQGVLASYEDVWYYKRNLSPLTIDLASGQPTISARFETISEVAKLPGFAQTKTSRHQFLDLAGDGRKDCVTLNRPGSGFYKRTADEDWENFTALQSVPNVEWNDPNLRFIDLNGDGHADVLVTEHDVFTWYPSLAEAGFDTAFRVAKPTDEEQGPAVVFADGTQTIVLADMTGDGLTDIVRVRNGAVCYWPNGGYGRFGSRIAMDNAPWFDAPDLFDPRRIRLADIDGSGTADIIYLASDAVRLYFNCAGNAWSDDQSLPAFPRIDNLSTVQAMDLMGNGTACLVWMSSLPNDTRRTMRYVDLMGGRKPHLLVCCRNNLGAETHVRYVPSTLFYLSDREQGTPWATRLPFPVHVVERVETCDWISRNRFVTRYAYHHGYFDGTEREFRGFGMVEQRDTEELGVLTGSGAFPNAANVDAASYIPPILTKTWFHTGAWPMGPYVTRIYDREYWAEPALTPAEAAATVLPDSALAADLTDDEIREALRSLKGAMLRQEVYGLDGTAAAALPYRVTERNYAINRLQPFGRNRHAVFLTHARESLSVHYERTLYNVAGTQRADPRVTHAFVLEADEFGNEKKSAAIAYGRRYDDPDPLLLTTDRAVQSAMLITYTESDYTNPILTADAWRSRLPADVRTYELTGYQPTGAAGRFQSSDFVNPAATGFELAFDSEIPYEATAGAGRQRRLIEQLRTLYRSDDMESGLPAGTLESLALPYTSYKLAMTSGLLATVYQRPHGGQPMENLLPDPAAVLRDQGGYVQTSDQQTLNLFPASEPPGDWWISSGRTFYSPGTSDTAAVELASAQAHFFIARRYQDAFGNSTTVTWDGHDLMPAQIADPLQNLVTATGDYRVLQPVTITDPNGNQSAVVFDALGLVAGTAVQDKSVTTQQDSLTGLVADLIQAQIDTFFADPRGPQAAVLLGNATSRIVYDLARFASLPSAPPAPAPGFAATIARETHVQDLPAGQASRLQVSITYSDGFGREIQSKVQADPGPLLSGGPAVKSRWIGSGWTIWNNKGKPVRKYEPFYSDTPDFSFGTLIGVSSTLFYDPVGRAVATLHPDHSWEKVVFDPWRQDSWDANDTILVPDPSSDPDVGSFFRRLPEADYLPTWYAQRSAGAMGAAAQDAGQKASLHANTPASFCFDSLGRAFLTFAFNRSTLNAAAPVEGHYRTFVTFDIEGRQRQITDALGRVVMTYDYDMPGKRLRQNSVDAGDRWILNDATGKPLLGWDSRDHQFEHRYDAARRPVEILVQTWLPTGSQNPVLAERNIYGEGQPNDQALNLRGRPFQQYDAAGVVTRASFDFKGNLLASSRQLLVDYQNPVDWSLASSPQLTGEVFTSASAFDALNRPVTLTSPDGSVTHPVYDDAGKLDQIAANLRALAATAFVTGIEYNARGQRTSIGYGNGAQTAYSYDPETFRLTELKTTRSSDNAVLQDLTYAYDPCGNVTSIGDAAQQTVYFSNQVVTPNVDYTYDAIYRLISAAGREHTGLLAQPQTTWDDMPRMNQPLPTDGQAMRNYSQNYSYDAMGNILQIAHRAVNGNWTRTCAYDEPNTSPTNNRLTSATVGALKETYAYDPHGSISQMPHLPQMTWDFKDQLARTQRQVVNSAPGEATYYVYDASGQRVRKVTQSGSGTKTRERIYLGGYEVYREYIGGGGAVTLERQTLHIMDDTQRSALVETLTRGSDGSPAQLVRYQFSNHQGSSSIELDGDAKTISYEEYYPYGSTSYQAVDAATKAAAKRYRYTGRERDEETGFSYHGARYYAIWLGRWVSCDPTGLKDGLNLYRYCSDSPARKSDKNGTADEESVLVAIRNVFQEKGISYNTETTLRITLHDGTSFVRRFDLVFRETLDNSLHLLEAKGEKPVANMTDAEKLDLRLQQEGGSFEVITPSQVPPYKGRLAEKQMLGFKPGDTGEIAAGNTVWVHGAPGFSAAEEDPNMLHAETYKAGAERYPSVAPRGPGEVNFSSGSGPVERIPTSKAAELQAAGGTGNTPANAEKPPIGPGERPLKPPGSAGTAGFVDRQLVADTVHVVGVAVEVGVMAQATDHDSAANAAAGIFVARVAARAFMALPPLAKLFLADAVISYYAGKRDAAVAMEAYKNNDPWRLAAWRQPGGGI